MLNNRWTRRFAPPIVGAVVIVCVWYGLQNRPASVDILSSSQASASSNPEPNPSHAETNANATVLPSISTSVKKQGAQVEFSVNTTPLPQVQKVEYYIESQFVGTAYSSPYAVTVSENSLAAGTHSVIAKIYMANATTQSQPTSFVAQPNVPVAPAADDIDPDNSTLHAQTTPSTNPSNPEPTPPVPISPTNVTAAASSDGTSATLGWTGTNDATSYQVWRDGVNVAATSDTNYIDTGLTPGHTYDYTITSLRSGLASDPSTAVPVTMPQPSSSGQNDASGATKSSTSESTNHTAQEQASDIPQDSTTT